MALGDFTNIRVESRDAGMAILRWDYANTLEVSIWRALNGASFSKIRVFPTDYPSSTVTSFIDDDVTEQVYYDYKLSDNDGATFTAIVSVTIQKKFPDGVFQDTKRVSLPTMATDEDITPYNMQVMADQLQNLLNSEIISAPRQCTVCPSNGSLVLDCTTGCYSFVVEAKDATDVNSISINCENLELTFNIPNATTIEVCGFPETTISTGDECLESPLSSTSVAGFPIKIVEDEVCTHVRTRVPAFPCVGEYTRDCYDDGSLFWDGTKFNFSMPTCGGASGCCVGNHTHGPTSSGGLTVFSGYSRVLDPAKPLAGMSILFGRQGSGTIKDAEVTLGSITAPISTKGKPIFGGIINVPVGSTVVNMSGVALIINYETNQYLIGTYTSANLRTGAMPGTIHKSATITGDPAIFFLSNFPSVGAGLFEIWDKDINTLFTFSNTGFAVAADPLMGYGFIWIGNTNPGVHAAHIGVSGGFSSITIG